MSKDTEDFIFTATAPWTGTFVNAVEPRKVTQSAKEEPKYSASFETDPSHPDVSAFRALVIDCAQAKWPGRDIGAAIKAGEFLVPIHSGDRDADKAKAKGKDREWSRGKQVLVARSQFQPEVSFIEGGRWVHLADQAAIVANKRRFNTGKECLFEVKLEAYDAVGEGKPGVTAYLNKVCATGGGVELIKGGPTGAESFKGYIGLDSQEDPTAGAAGGGNDW